MYTSLMSLLIRSSKQYIEEAEDQWVDEHLEEWDAGKFSVGDRRVLLTYWVAEAWKKLYQDHQDAIIKTFQNVVYLFLRTVQKITSLRYGSSTYDDCRLATSS